MKLPDLLTVDSLEAAYAAWCPEADPLMHLPIALPNPLPFCVEAPLLQLIASASRKLKDLFEVRLDGLVRESNAYNIVLTNALGNTHTLCAWLMAAQVQDEKGEAIPKSDSHVFSQYLDAMDSYDFLSTHASSQMRVNLVCVQGAQREFIQPLYHEVKGKKVVRPYPDVRLFVQDILSQLVGSWTGKELRDVSAPLAQLVKELMENSDWWARTDESGTPYRRGKGFRVLSFRLVDVDDDNAAIFGGSNHHLHNYLQNILLEKGELDGGITSSRERSMRRNTFIELSIVDSGPGLARRWLASRETEKMIVKDLAEIDLQDEEQAVMECFQKWATSSHNSLRGVGLFSVARMLREKNGFMRLRTGRLAYLFGTHSAAKDVEKKVKGLGQIGEQLHHVLSDGTHVFTEDHEVAFFLRPWSKDSLSAVEGTSYSILLPV
jgi:hypothetical protein